MKQTIHLILYIVAAILMIGCTGNSGTKGYGSVSKARERHVPQASDTLYTEKAAMDVYGTQPERALEIIDSAEIVGNLTGDRASLLRAKVFCLTCGKERLDTARQICEALLQSNFVKDAPENREPVLDLLVTISRKKHDNEQWLRWATEKANFCRQQGNKTEALRTEAEIGIILTHLGRQDEGMAKLDDVIRQLDGTRKFNEMDAILKATSGDYAGKNTRQWDSTAKVPYLVDGSNNILLSYDDEESVTAKGQFVKDNGIGGAMFWEFRHDDKNGTLRKALCRAIYGKESTL